MRGAKGVVDVNMLAAGQFVGEVGGVGFLFMVKAQVLEQDGLPRRQRIDHASR